MRAVVFVWLAVFMMIAAFFIIPFTDGDGNTFSVVRSAESGFVGIVETPPQTSKLRAMVKGSIYETGELMSVFGTCFNESDMGYPDSYATFSAWYPNGTQFMFDDPMEMLQQGYFLHNSAMEAVEGTYLTEMVCRIAGSDDTASAWGEWQNPFWVRRLALLNETISNLEFNATIDLSGIEAQLTGISEQIVNQTLQIGELSWDMENYFNTTWELQNETIVLINNTYTDLAEQITYVSWVANQSVDRNDSYLAQLLQMLAGTIGVPVTGNLTVVETAQDPVFFRMWGVEARVFNEYGVQVGWPVVSCSISTTNYPLSSNVAMVPKQSSAPSQDVHFTHSEKIQVSGEFDWTIVCVYN